MSSVNLQVWGELHKKVKGLWDLKVLIYPSGTPNAQHVSNQRTIEDKYWNMGSFCLSSELYESKYRSNEYL